MRELTEEERSKFSNRVTYSSTTVNCKSHADVSTWKYEKHKEEAVKITVKKKAEETKVEEKKAEETKEKKVEETNVEGSDTASFASASGDTVVQVSDKAENSVS